jgi:hypothetical protein
MTAEELKEVITAKIAEILPPETNGADTSQ